MSSNLSRKVLLVTPFFAPQSHAAVFRVHKLAKYLSVYGWEPIVLTVDRNYNYNEDPLIASELSRDLLIYKAKYIEPSFRGLRMALGGKDRTFVATNSPSAPTVPPARSGFLQKVYKYFLDNYFQSPDVFWTWRASAVKAAEKLIREHNIKVVYTTCFPYTSNVIGYDLKRRTGCKWVADFRDPLTYAHTTRSKISRIFNKQTEIIRDTHMFADAVVGLAASYNLIFFDMYLSNRTIFIPTGMDDQLLDENVDIEIPKHPYILFAGEYLVEYKDIFFRVLKGALEKPQLKNSGIKYLIVGNEKINRKVAEPYIEKLELGAHVDFVGHIPQKKLYKLIRSALAVTLIPGDTSFWWTNFAKMVDFIALQKPVIAMVANPSEARSELTKCGLGLFLDGDFNHQIDKLSQFLLNPQNYIQPVKQECERYLASHMVKKFAEIFDSLV